MSKHLVQVEESLHSEQVGITELHEMHSPFWEKWVGKHNVQLLIGFLPADMQDKHAVLSLQVLQPAI